MEHFVFMNVHNLNLRKHTTSATESLFVTHTLCVSTKPIKESAKVNRYSGNHFFVRVNFGTDRYCLDPDNDPIRDQMIREFPDDVTTR